MTKIIWEYHALHKHDEITAENFSKNKDVDSMDIVMSPKAPTQNSTHLRSYVFIPEIFVDGYYVRSSLATPQQEVEKYGNF